MQRLACIVIFCVIASVGCSESARYRLKHWFFEIPENASVASQTVEETPHTPPSVPEVQVRTDSKYQSIHPPYLGRECKSCHDATHRMHPRETFLTVCRGCHEDFFSPRVGHFPVSQGQCLACHNMHRSEQESLLHLPVLDTCLECHDEPEDLSEEAHNEGEGVDDCTRCHDPHFGESPLLKDNIKTSAS